MTPREAIIESLNLRRPEGLVPHCELEFQLSEEMFGKPALRGHMLDDVGADERERMLQENAEMWVECAERFNWSVIHRHALAGR